MKYTKEHIVPREVSEADLPKSKLRDDHFIPNGKIRYANLLYEKTEGKHSIQVRVALHTTNKGGAAEPYWNAYYTYPTFQLVRIEKVRFFYYKVTSIHEVRTATSSFGKRPELMNTGGTEKYAFRFFEEELGTETAQLIAGIYEYMIDHHLLWGPGTD